MNQSNSFSNSHLENYNQNILFLLKCPFEKAKKLNTRVANERNITASNESNGTENRRRVIAANNGDKMEVQQEEELKETNNASRGNQAGK